MNGAFINDKGFIVKVFQGTFKLLWSTLTLSKGKGQTDQVWEDFFSFQC